jgi:hypothetical protein
LEDVVMLDVREAAQRAAEYFAVLYQDQNPQAVQLEEVELAEDDSYWFITLSYPQSDFNVLNFKRKYKIFKIDAKTGDVISMKIRKVE